MLTRLLGPVRGYYVSVSNLPVGEVGERHVGMFRIYAHEPATPFEAGPVREGTTSEPRDSRRMALDEAEDAAFSVLAQLAPGPSADRSASGVLQSVAYASSVTRQPQPGELAELLRAARESNERYGLTGLLLYEDGQFLQYLEGPPPHLELVYRSIRRNPLHEGLVELMRKRITQRVFANWAMGFQAGPRDYWTAQPAELLLERLPPGSVKSLLQDFLLRAGDPAPSGRR